MNILSICGSPHQNGISQQMLDTFLAGFPYKVTGINPYRMNISPCTACGQCEKGNLCPIEDDMQTVYTLIEQSDVIVVATPVYYNSVPAPLKALIDRTMCLYNRYFVAGPKGPLTKKGVLLCSSGSDDFFTRMVIKSQIKQFFDVCRASFDGAFFMSGTDRQKKPDLKKLQELMDKIKQNDTF